MVVFNWTFVIECVRTRTFSYLYYYYLKGRKWMLFSGVFDGFCAPRVCVTLHVLVINFLLKMFRSPCFTLYESFTETQCSKSRCDITHSSKCGIPLRNGNVYWNFWKLLEVSCNSYENSHNTVLVNHSGALLSVSNL